MITAIGDVHQKYPHYFRIVEQCEYSLQLGDMGFVYTPLNRVDPTKHKFFHGNHDNIEILKNRISEGDNEEDIILPPLHYLDRYGVYNHNGVEFFYISGGFSIDKSHRTQYIDYWADEELSLSEAQNALELYAGNPPDIMITHECPRQIANIIGNPRFLKSWGFDPETFTTKTSELLQTCFETHQPKLWVFGHFHLEYDEVVNGTRFICLPELGTVDVYPDGTVDKRYIRI